MDFSCERVQQTLQSFYCQGSGQSQFDANQYLTLAQISPQAWNFSWELLKPEKPPEVQFFGASTLHTKISKCWHEVPLDEHVTLKQKLLELLLGYINGPKVVMTRVCISLAAYVIQTLPTSWPNAITDIVSALHPSSLPGIDPQRLALVLLELLTVLPEEFQTARLQSTQRGFIRIQLQSSMAQVFALSQDVLWRLQHEQNPSVNSDLCQVAIKCFSSWAQLDAVTLEYETLLGSVMFAAKREDLCQTALEALSNVAVHADAYKYPNSLLKFVEKLVTLSDILKKALPDHDMEICCSLYGLYVSIGENHSSLLLKSVLERPETKETVLRLIQLILECSGTPGQYPVDEICSEQAFGFWYTFQDDMISAEPALFQQYLLVFHSVFLALVDTYLVKGRFPSDIQYEQWHSDEKESFRCYRQDIADSFMYCYNVLRKSLLASVMAHLQLATEAATRDPSQWQYLEICLYAFRSVAESVELNETSYLPKFFGILPSLPLQHIRVISTTMESIGAYAEWINMHPEVLEGVIPLLLLGVSNAEVAPASSMALKDITRDCQAAVIPYAGQILNACKRALEQGVLKYRERVRLMTTVGQVLSVMPTDVTLEFLNTLLTPLLSQFNQALQLEPSASVKSSVVFHLNLLSVLFASLDIKRNSNSEQDKGQLEEAQQPIFLVLQQVLPLLSNTAVKWAADQQVAEALCEGLKRAVCTLLDDCLPLVPEICLLVISIYVSQPETVALDVAKQLLLLFSQSETVRNQLVTLLTQITSHSLMLFQKDMREHTGVSELYFKLLTQLLKKTPSFLEQCGLEQTVIFQCAIAALSLPEKSTVKAVSMFLVEFISHSREVPSMLDVVNVQGEALTEQVLKVIGGESPRSVVEHMPDVLMSLNKKYFDNLCRWMSNFVQKDGFPSQRVHIKHKEDFARMVLKERSNKRKLKEIVTEFSLLCRGLYGSQYGAQTAYNLLS